jgi:hypothetical protein
MKINTSPRPWSWAAQAHPRQLSDWGTAPETHGFYELGFLTDREFRPVYCGRAAGVTLRSRLRQHYAESHNPEVRRHAPELWYRCKSFPSPEMASFVEAVHLAALDYPWNKRNEWAKHWALET